MLDLIVSLARQDLEIGPRSLMTAPRGTFLSHHTDKPPKPPSSGGLGSRPPSKRVSRTARQCVSPSAMITQQLPEALTASSAAAFRMKQLHCK